MRHFLSPAILTLALLVMAAPGRAQNLPLDSPPAHLAVVDGTASLERDGGAQPAAEGMPFVPGDRLRTERGRVELLFPDGTALDVDEFTVLELSAIDRLQLFEGRVLFAVPGAANPSTATSFHVDTQVAGIDTYGPGEYRIALVNGRFGLEAELAVSRGSGALTGDRGTQNLRAGQVSTVAREGLPSYPQTFNTARFDAFTQWAADRRDERIGSVSAQYLPPDLRIYSSALDQDGAWQYESSYGYVWYPAVAANWRPYYDGYWSSVPSYGWTWVGAARWAWPTHHYGRWGVAGARWFWIPERHFAPAWVSWSAAPGYVGWCPLGFDNRPVFSISAHFESSRAAINAWVVMPREHFGVGSVPVQRFATTREALPPRTPFIAQTPSPAGPSNAATRRLAAPLPAATSATAVPRTDVSSAVRIPDRRAASGRTTPTAPSASTLPAAPAAAALERRTPTPAPRPYAPNRSNPPGYMGSVPNVSAPASAGVSPVYAPRPVDSGTYGAQGRYAPGGAVPRYAPGAATPGGNPGVANPRSDPGDRFRHLDPASQAGSRGDATPRTTPPPGDPGSPGSRGPRAQPVPASTGAPAPATGTSSSSAPAASAPAGSAAPAQPRGHRAR